MDDTGKHFTVELTSEELRITSAALRSFLQDFGHDERDVRDQIRSVLAKLPADATAEHAA